MSRRLLVLLSLAGAALAALSLVRRGSGRRRERVDLYYDDGSMVSLEEGVPGAATMLSLGRDALRSARAGG